MAFNRQNLERKFAGGRGVDHGGANGSALAGARVDGGLKASTTVYAAMLAAVLSGCGDQFVSGGNANLKDGGALTGDAGAGGNGGGTGGAGGETHSDTDAGVTTADGGAGGTGADGGAGGGEPNDGGVNDAGDSGCVKEFNLEIDKNSVTDQKVEHGQTGLKAGCFVVSVNNCAVSLPFKSLDLSDSNPDIVAFSPVKVINPLTDQEVASTFIPEVNTKKYHLDLGNTEIFSGQPLKFCLQVDTTNIPAPGEVHQLKVVAKTDVGTDNGAAVTGSYPVEFGKFTF